MLAVAAAVALLASANTHHATRPNLLLILEDDGGYNGVGYMNERLFPHAGARLHTPVLDALAASAV